MLLGLGVAGAISVVHFTPLRVLLTDLQAWKNWIDSRGFAAHLVFIAAGSAAVACGMPRLILAAAAGLIFGFAEGCLTALVIALTGSWGACLFARWGGGKWAADVLQRRPKLASLLRQPGIADIFLLRQLPVPGLLPNLLCGLTRVPHRTFLLGSLAGFLPSTVAVTLVGSSLGKESLEKALGQIAAAMLALGVAGWAMVQITRRIQQRRSAAGSADPSISS